MRRVASGWTRPASTRSPRAEAFEPSSAAAGSGGRRPFRGSSFWTGRVRRVRGPRSAAGSARSYGSGSPPGERRKASTASTRRFVFASWSIRSFRKICFTCASTVRSLMKSALADGVVREAFGDEAEHVALALAELVDRVSLAPSPEKPRDDRRIDDGLPLAQPPQRVDERGRIVDAVLEQVAGPLGVILEQPHREARLDVLREHEHADRRVELTDALRRDDPLVGVRRRHADVDDRAIGLGRRDRAHQPVDVAGLADDLDAGAVEHAHDPLAGEHRVIGNDDSHASSLTRAERAVTRRRRGPVVAPVPVAGCHRSDRRRRRRTVVMSSSAGASRRRRRNRCAAC